MLSKDRGRILNRKIFEIIFPIFDWLTYILKKIAIIRNNSRLILFQNMKLIILY
jgi:hypothetical protein